MKHYVLVSVERVPDDKGWNGFEYSLKNRIELSGGGKRLSENVWLLDRENDVEVFAHVVAQAAEHHIPYEVRFFSEEGP